jgi:FlaA1/EpsC-like NDP-sugar epimerase
MLFAASGTDKGAQITPFIILQWSIASGVFFAISSIITRSYRIIIRHSTMRDLANLVTVVTLSELMQGAVVYIVEETPLSDILWLMLLDAIFTFLLLIVVRLAMIVSYDLFKSKMRERMNIKRILVYGTHEKSIAVITRLLDSSHYDIVGFISPSSSDKRIRISNFKVYHASTEEELNNLATDLGLSGILFTTEQDAQTEQDRLIQMATSLNIKILVVPSINEVEGNNLLHYRVREIKIEDLLGRPEIEISIDEIRKRFSDNVILVTGAAGSIGSELCRQLAQLNVKKLVLFDNAETPMHNIRLELEDTYPNLKFVPVIGDVRSVDRLDFVFREHRPSVVFHAAAYKHVPLMEENPCEAVHVNVIGSKNVADKCLQYGVEMMVMVSTDKAVNPTNIMGCTKRLAEIYVQSLGLALTNGKQEGNTRFVTTRFGNVLGSNGSVIPRFRTQIECGGPVTVTDPEINRFFMTIPEACRLVMEAATISTGNQIVVFDMGTPVKIVDLARRMIELAGFVPEKDIPIVFTGLRPGEKLYEEVLSTRENTDPTSHDRIRVARVREYDYDEVKAIFEKMERLALDVYIPDMVRLMKDTVPEFKSKNSRFEIYDK